MDELKLVFYEIRRNLKLWKNVPSSVSRNLQSEQSFTLESFIWNIFHTLVVNFLFHISSRQFLLLYYPAPTPQFRKPTMHKQWNYHEFNAKSRKPAVKNSHCADSRSKSAMLCWLLEEPGCTFSQNSITKCLKTTQIKSCHQIVAPHNCLQLVFKRKIMLVHVDIINEKRISKKEFFHFPHFGLKTNQFLPPSSFLHKK